MFCTAFKTRIGAFRNVTHYGGASPRVEKDDRSISFTLWCQYKVVSPRNQTAPERKKGEHPGGTLLLAINLSSYV